MTTQPFTAVRCSTCRRPIPACWCVECRLCHKYADPETCVIGPPDWETGECEATCEECVDRLERAFWGED